MRERTRAIPPVTSPEYFRAPMANAGSIPAWFRMLQIAVFALLAVNTAWYLYAGNLSKGLDAAAWLLLLGLFAAETQFANVAWKSRGRATLRGLRLVAALGICAAGVAYIIERDALDAINTALWIGVVILLELEVRRAQEVARHRRAFTAAAGVLYGGLALLVVIWGWRGEWFDAYDALLWLGAFAALEMDVLGVAPTQTAG